tara:strand:+ start:507 stop:677 length:171 start_codon:yes stop_codon:yes gene_type:complete
LEKITYEYQGKSRPEKRGIKKSFDIKELDSKKIESLIKKGWVEVKPKAKPKAKKKK